MAGNGHQIDSDVGGVAEFNGKRQAMSDKEKFAKLEREIGVSFENTPLLVHALSHSSYIYERDLPYSDGNERLEFLGDSVLGLVMAEYVYGLYPNSDEGILSKIKSVVVSKKILARTALRLGLGEFIYLGRGEELTGGRQRRSLLANVMESLIGAVYLDQGFESAKEFVLRNLAHEVEPAAMGKSIRDNKSELQELAQRRSGQVPRYRVTHTDGPDHDRVFEIEVYLEDNCCGVGTGKSKKSAEQKAAAAALRRLKELAAEEENQSVLPDASSKNRKSPAL